MTTAINQRTFHLKIQKSIIVRHAQSLLLYVDILYIIWIYISFYIHYYILLLYNFFTSSFFHSQWDHPWIQIIMWFVFILSFIIHSLKRWNFLKRFSWNYRADTSEFQDQMLRNVSKLFYDFVVYLSLNPLET